MRTLFTSESVTEGHPDKVCDQIADAVLDAIIEKDPVARVACECCATTGLVLVMGEISTSSYISIADIARQKIREIGYDNAACGFDGNACAVMVSVDEQSPDIAMGVNDALEGRTEHRFDIGAGDQAACRGAKERPCQLPPARRQGAGDGGVPGRRARPRRHGGALHPAQPRRRSRHH